MCARIVKSRRIFSSPLFQQSCVLTGKWVEWNGGMVAWVVWKRTKSREAGM